MQKNINGPNCNLKVSVSPENSMIYVYNNKPSFHKINIYSCSCIDKIDYCGNLENKNNVVYGQLGNYYIMEDGILFIPKKCDNNKLELLSLIVTDTCANKVKITVPFFMNKSIRNKKTISKKVDNV